jgi:hypothetical protein
MCHTTEAEKNSLIHHLSAFSVASARATRNIVHATPMYASGRCRFWRSESLYPLHVQHQAAISRNAAANRSRSAVRMNSAGVTRTQWPPATLRFRLGSPRTYLAQASKDLTSSQYPAAALSDPTYESLPLIYSAAACSPICLPNRRFDTCMMKL